MQSVEQEQAASNHEKGQYCGPNLSERRAIRYGPFEVDLNKEVVSHNGCRLKLCGKTYQAMLALVESAGDVVTRTALRDRLWSDPPADWNSSLNTTMNKVRQALGGSFYIETIPRKGYLLLSNPQFSPQPAETVPDAIRPNGSNRSHLRSAQLPATTSLFWSVSRVIMLIVFGMLVGAGMMAIWFDVTLKAQLGVK